MTQHSLRCSRWWPRTCMRSGPCVKLCTFVPRTPVQLAIFYGYGYNLKRRPELLVLSTITLNGSNVPVQSGDRDQLQPDHRREGCIELYGACDTVHPHINSRLIQASTTSLRTTELALDLPFPSRSPLLHSVPRPTLLHTLGLYHQRHRITHGVAQLSNQLLLRNLWTQEKMENWSKASRMTHLRAYRTN